MIDKNLDKVRQEAEDIYHAIGNVHCPYFKGEVTFNRKGLNHIKFKNQRTARNRSDQYVRMKNIKFASRILEKSNTLQEYRVVKTFVESKKNKRREKVLKDVKFYGFIAIVQDGDMIKRLKIIVKEVSGGKRYFWSIIPFWRSNKELKIYSGNPEID